MIRYDWSAEEIKAVHDQPFSELLYQAQTVHRQHFSPSLMQRSTLVSVKTGECSEDCAYCAQSTHHCTEIEVQPMLSLVEVVERARAAKASGSTRLCLSVAWREVEEGRDFEEILAMVRAVRTHGMEVCCTLGLLDLSQARRLKEAGCDYYNHNLDTSPEYYGRIVSTHSYQDRLRTLRHLREAGVKICSGGIVGMGEQPLDRFELLRQLSSQRPHADSVPINMLVPIPGTPLAAAEKLDARASCCRARWCAWRPDACSSETKLRRYASWPGPIRSLPAKNC
jgi:biotin synthase